MSSTAHYPSLTIDDSATAWILGTKYKVIHLAGEHYVHGWTAEEILRQHPDLAPEQVYAALAFFYEHKREMVAELKQEATHPSSLVIRDLNREELRQRLSTKNP